MEKEIKDIINSLMATGALSEITISYRNNEGNTDKITFTKGE